MLVQTVAVAVGSMPLSAGFVGVIPALETLLKPSEGGPLHISMPKLIFWSLGVAFFGVFFAVPLRRQVIIKEKLKFPSGTATALMISVLHGDGHVNGTSHDEEEIQPISSIEAAEAEEKHARSWREKTRLLGYSFAVSGIYVSDFLSQQYLSADSLIDDSRPSHLTSFQSSVTSPSLAPRSQQHGSGH